MSLDSVTEYALSFSEDAVHLLHREKVPGHRVGWRHIGSVEFSSPEFRTELAGLRAMATGEQDDLSLPVTLLIPDDQILYTTLTVAPGADRERAVGKALDGLTPYAVEDLAFDWNGDGDSVRVAAVARQTLSEAQGFAARYGFDGHSYRADPRPGNFPDEPVFTLEVKQKPGRPGIDLSQAGVTSAGLQLEADEAEAKVEPVAEASQEAETVAPMLDLDLEPDAVVAPAPKAEEKEIVTAETSAETEGEVAGPEEDTAPVEPTVAEQSDVEEPAAESDEIAAEELTDNTKMIAETVDSEGDPATDPVIEGKPEVTDEPTASEDAPAFKFDAEPEVAAEADAKDEDAPQGDEEAEKAAVPVSDEAEAVAEPVAEAEVAEPAATPETDVEDGAEAAAPSVVRHAPSRQGAKPLVAPVGPEGKLNPRAQAFHKRAAEARQGAAAPAVDARPKRPRDSNGLGSLLLMLAVLVVGLFFAWAFLVPGSTTTEAPQETSAPEGTPTAEAPADPVATPEPTEPATSAPEAAAPEAVEPAPVDGAQVTPPAGETQSAAATPSPAPAQPAAQPDAPRVSALTPIEQRRAVVAAAAVAAAVVPPAQIPAATTPAASATAPTPSTPAPVATAPAAPTRAAPQQPAVAATRPAAPRANAPARATSAPAATAPAARAPAAPAPSARLTSSARPMLSPRRTTPVTSTPRADSAPAVPANPLPYEAAQRSVQPKSSSRPPARAVQRRAPAATPAAAPAAPVATPAAPSQGASLRGSSRPPSRPEGSLPDFDADAPLTPQDQSHLEQQMRDLRAVMGARAEAATADQPVRLAQARPTRRPASAATASDAVRPSAVDAALQQASDSPPDRPTASASAAAPARDSGGLLRGGSRPRARPSSVGSGTAVAGSAVESAVAAAVNTPAATPGGVQLSALSGSAHPPRRSAGAAAAAAAAATPSAPEAAAAATPPAEQVVASNQGPSDAELAERRRLDEQLQAQAEARIRARAQADAAAEAQARAQAEARARAQAQAEERAATARRQTYKPPEVDDEPEVMAALPRGQTSASVARSATQARGIDLGRTTIIGIIGAGNASRALIRLRNGKIVTVRLGDRIDGGTINSIGDGKLTYVKAGRQHELRMLDGR